MNKPRLKPVIWGGTSYEDLRDLPASVQYKIGTAIQKVQYGSRPATIRTLSGFGSVSDQEIKVNDDGSTYRAVYTVRFAGYVFVLHTFQKKSTRGSETTKQDMDIIRDRLRLAETQYEELLAQQRREREQ
ncbi:MAG: type II toxin-antitoxin system RelE/ParE family toxin [Janthinobacterium lividum]